MMKAGLVSLWLHENTSRAPEVFSVPSAARLSQVVWARPMAFRPRLRACLAFRERYVPRFLLFLWPPRLGVRLYETYENTCGTLEPVVRGGPASLLEALLYGTQHGIFPNQWLPVANHD